MNRLYILLAALLANIAMLSLASCSDDDNGGGQPVIECVRTTDPEKADSTFTDAMVGQMILIQGTNLNDAKHIYINNQDVYFNKNYNTSTHIIVTIPSELVVHGMDESLPLEIRVETSHGTATYAFHVIAGYPSIEMYKADLPLNADGIPEMVPGQEVKLIGELLHEVQHIYVTDLDTVPLYEVTEFRLNADRTELTLTMPSNPIPEYGIFMLDCYAGEAYCGFSRSPMEPEVYDVYPDMPLPGQKVVIVGKYLTNLVGLNLGGEMWVDVEEVTENESMTQFTFTMPATLPTADSNGKLAITTLGGKAELPFYNYDWIYEDFDGHGTPVWWQWGTNCAWGVDAPDGFTVPLSSGKLASFNGANTGWWNNEYVHHKELPADIPMSTPIADIDFRYEVYLGPDAKVMTGINFSGKYAEAEIADHIEGKVLPGQWMSVAIPMSQFVPDMATWGDFVNFVEPGLDSDNFIITHSTEAAGDMLTAYDNFRFYIRPQKN